MNNTPASFTTPRATKAADKAAMIERMWHLLALAPDTTLAVLMERYGISKTHAQRCRRAIRGAK